MRGPRWDAGGANAQRRSPAQHGAVTAELALLLPAVVMVLLVLVDLAGAGMTAIRVTDAARAAARAAAIGEESTVVVAVARHLGGAHAQVDLRAEGPFAVVTVTRDLPGLLGAADLSARATARALREPGQA